MRTRSAANLSQDDSSDNDIEDDKSGKRDADFILDNAASVRKDNWTFDEMQKLSEYVKKNPKHKFKTIKNRFRRLQNKRMLYRILDNVKKHGTLPQKQAVITEAVVQKFRSARDDGLPVHDRDMRGWGKQKAREVTAGNFKASMHWLSNLKKKYGISSRRVTKLCTKKQLKDAPKIAQSAAEFRAKALKEISYYQDDLIFNTDQSGFVYQMHSTRTQSKTGEKITVLAVDSLNKCTHSYTVQPLLDYNGRLRGKLYLCLQEKGGRMGKRVEKTYQRRKNVDVTCSKSGNLTKSLFKRFVKRILVPEAYDHYLLLLDSWTGQLSDENYEDFPENITCKCLQIPPKTTSVLQPLDVYYFRQWKEFAAMITDYVMLNKSTVDVDLGARDEIIKMQSLIHNQFSSERFVPMGLAAWYKSELRPDSPGKFENASQILFPADLGFCAMHNCSEKAFLRCSYCRNDLCFSHFYKDYHTHFDT